MNIENVNFNEGFNGELLTQEEVDDKKYHEKMALIKIIDAKKEIDSGRILDYEQCITHCGGDKDQGRLMLIDKHTLEFGEFYNKRHIELPEIDLVEPVEINDSI